MWNDVESKLKVKRERYVLWPFTRYEYRNYLIIPTHDFTDKYMNKLTSPMLMHDSSNFVNNSIAVIKYRQYFIDWKQLRLKISRALIKNRNRSITINPNRIRLNISNVIEKKQLSNDLLEPG